MHNTKICRNSHDFSPEMIVGWIGNPKQYRIAPDDFKSKRAIIKFTTVDKMMVTKIELMYEIQRVPESRATKIC